MKPQRIEEIKNYIYENKTVTLEQICNRFNISTSTLRRDLNEIIATSDIKKVYGGVTVLSKREMTSYDERYITNQTTKKLIASAAAGLIEDGDIVFIDSGTTMPHVISHLVNKKNITVLTNNIEVINAAVPLNNINVIMLSGTLYRKTLSFIGPSAVQLLHAYNINKALIATTGYSIESGLTCSTPLEADLKRVAIERSKEVYLLADSSKYGAVSLVTYCSLNKVNILITEKTPPDEVVEYMEKNGRKILLAQQ